MTFKVDGTNGLLQAYDYQVLTTGFSYTFAAGVQLLLAVPAGTLATGTVTMPSTPADGMNITVTSTQEITALTVNANTGQSIVGGGANLLSAGGSFTFVYRLANTTWYSQNNNAARGINSQLITSSGTFTIPTGASSVKATVIGGGGGGGGVSTVNNVRVGSGGGGGGAAVKFLTGLTPGNTITVTVGPAGTAGTTAGGAGGAGGTTSISSGTQTISTVSATGGAGGTGNINQAVTVYTPAAGGAGSGGDLNYTGGSASFGVYYTVACIAYVTGGSGGGVSNAVPALSLPYYFPSLGGDGLLGGRGGATAVTTAGVAGTAGTGYGCGGSSSAKTTGATAYAGGAGSAGVVLIEW